MLNYTLLDEDLRGSFERYIEHRIPPGHFLTAVLSNDLAEACARADIQNRGRLFSIVQWIYNEAPAACWGSPAQVAAWLNGGGT